jgi:hypothetical protein
MRSRRGLMTAARLLCRPMMPIAHSLAAAIRSAAFAPVNCSCRDWSPLLIVRHTDDVDAVRANEAKFDPPRRRESEMRSGGCNQCADRIVEKLFQSQ